MLGKHKIIITVNFFDEKKQMTLPENFKSFIVKISQRFKLNVEELLLLKFKYIDSDGDQISLDNLEDYYQLYSQCSSKEVNEVKVYFQEPNMLNNPETEVNIERRKMEIGFDEKEKNKGVIKKIYGFCKGLFN